MCPEGDHKRQWRKLGSIGKIKYIRGPTSIIILSLCRIHLNTSALYKSASWDLKCPVAECNDLSSKVWKLQVCETCSNTFNLQSLMYCFAQGRKFTISIIRHESIRKDGVTIQLSMRWSHLNLSAENTTEKLRTKASRTLSRLHWVLNPPLSLAVPEGETPGGAYTARKSKWIKGSFYWKWTSHTIKKN